MQFLPKPHNFGRFLLMKFSTCLHRILSKTFDVCDSKNISSFILACKKILKYGSCDVRLLEKQRKNLNKSNVIWRLLQSKLLIVYFIIFCLKNLFHIMYLLALRLSVLCLNASVIVMIPINATIPWMIKKTLNITSCQSFFNSVD